MSDDEPRLTLERLTPPPDWDTGDYGALSITPDLGDEGNVYRVILPSAVHPRVGERLCITDPEDIKDVEEDAEFWVVSEDDVSRPQAIVGFRKHGTVGIGARLEPSWNTNLPYGCSADVIYDHIEGNLRPWRVPREEAIAAIELIRAAAIIDEPESDLRLRRLANLKL